MAPPPAEPPVPRGSSRRRRLESRSRGPHRAVPSGPVVVRGAAARHPARGVVAGAGVTSERRAEPSAKADAALVLAGGSGLGSASVAPAALLAAAPLSSAAHSALKGPQRRVTSPISRCAPPPELVRNH
jgi:hypothetical protein